MTACLLARRAAPGIELVPPGVLELWRLEGPAAFPFVVRWRALADPSAVLVCAVAATEADGLAHLHWAAARAEADDVLVSASFLEVYDP